MDLKDIKFRPGMVIVSEKEPLERCKVKRVHVENGYTIEIPGGFVRKLSFEDSDGWRVYSTKNFMRDL